MYELFILGQLMDYPMTGYALRKAFITIAGNDQAISFGTLYPLMDKLERSKMIDHKFETTENERIQKLAAITESGKKRFYELATVKTPVNKQTQLTFLMKIHFLHLLNLEQQVFVLEDFQDFSEAKLQHLQSLKKGLEINDNMIQADIDDALLVKQLQILRAQVQIDWIAQLLKERKGA